MINIFAFQSVKALVQCSFWVLLSLIVNPLGAQGGTQWRKMVEVWGKWWVLVRGDLIGRVGPGGDTMNKKGRQTNRTKGRGRQWISPIGRIGNKQRVGGGEKRCEEAEVLWFCGRNRELLGRGIVSTDSLEWFWRSARSRVGEKPEESLLVCSSVP